MTTKINTKWFFEDKNFAKEVKLTQEEGKLLDDFEYKDYYHSGFANISGGFSNVVLEEFDEEYDHIILGFVRSGIQNDCENVVYTDKIIFNRQKKTIVFE